MKPSVAGHEIFPDAHHDPYSRTILGFWLFLMSDFVMFGSFFATFAVLSHSTFGGPSAKDLFSPHYAFLQALLLLTCSFTVGLAGAAAHRKNKKETLVLFGLTFLLGLGFLIMMVSEFSRLLSAGHGWEKSAFLSAYYTIVGTFAAHVLFGLLWIIVLIIPVLRQGDTYVSIRRLTTLRMFWQFLNIVWVFIFSFVYLLGVD
jgi:cytochrome o ubiquinol oxidase subunit 3